jgi:hypothetical protein
MSVDNTGGTERGGMTPEETLKSGHQIVAEATVARMREFETGATRNNDATEPDYEGFMSPLVVHRFGEYMNKHRVQSDGQIRDSDNWQRGIPQRAYMKSLWRHVVDVWLHERRFGDRARDNEEEALCAILFNASGKLHEILKEKP